MCGDIGVGAMAEVGSIVSFVTENWPVEKVLEDGY